MRLHVERNGERVAFTLIDMGKPIEENNELLQVITQEKVPVDRYISNNEIACFSYLTDEAAR
jgi:hypothetical protein